MAARMLSRMNVRRKAKLAASVAKAKANSTLTKGLAMDFSEPSRTQRDDAAVHYHDVTRVGRQLFDLAPIASLLMDCRGTLIAANRAALPLMNPPITFRADAMKRLHYLDCARWIPFAIPIAELFVSSRCEFNLLSPAFGACKVRLQTSADYKRDELVLAVISTRAANDPERIRDVFGMSAAEARVVGLLLQGMSAKQAAEVLQVKVCTVRTHIQRALEKTSSARQSELISKVLTPL